VKKILIVEDDPVARGILHKQLSSSYQVEMTGDAMAAFTQARKSPPDLIVLDLGLPAGGGYTVLQRLKSIPALSVIPVLVVSGLDRAENEQKALAAGATAFLSKQPSDDELLNKIKQMLGDQT